jgi:HEAT repeat protein
MNTVLTGFRTHRVALIVWLIIIIGIIVLIGSNRAAQSREYAGLTSPSQQIRDAMVLHLVQNGSLVDVLTSTEDPNTDSTSPQNVKSATIRENAAASVNRLSASGKITAAQAMDTMFQLTKDTDTTVQTTAEAGLQALGEKNDVYLDDLVAKLNDGDPDIRSAAVTVLGLIGTAPGFGDKTAKRVNAVITDPSSQASAESAMQGIGAPAVPYLAADLTAPNAPLDFQQQLVTLLGQIGTPNALPILTDFAHSSQPSLRHEAYVALATIVIALDAAWQNDVKTAKTPPAILKTANANLAQARLCEPILITALKNTNSDSQTRSQAALALGDIQNPAAIKALVTALGDYDSQVQQSAISGLQSIGPLAVGPLTAALTQADQQTQASAAEALGGIGTPAAVAALNTVFEDPATSSIVARSAAVGLGRSGSKSVIPTLVKALGNKSGSVEAAASDALLTPSLAAPAIPLMIASFTQPTPVPFNAAQTLSRLGNEAVPQLDKAAQSSNPQVQTWAAIALGETGSKDPSINTVLQPLTKSSNKEVSYAASQALDTLAGATS